MPQQVLVLSFKFHISSAQYRRAAGLFARDFSRVPGLMHSLWLVNEARCEAGGVYIFEDESSLQSFLEGPFASQVTNHPALSDVSIKHYGLIVPTATAEHDPTTGS